MVITVSGVPGSGKTTYTQHLQQAFDGKILVLPEFLEPFPQEVARAAELGYQGQIQAQDWVIQQHAKKHAIAREARIPVAMERGPLDALAYGRALGKDVYQYCVQRTSEIDWLPTHTVLLQSPIDVIKARFLRRDNVTLDDWNNYWEGLINRVNDGYLSTNYPFESMRTLVDTNRPIHEVQAELHRHLEREFDLRNITSPEGASVTHLSNPYVRK